MDGIASPSDPVASPSGDRAAPADRRPLRPASPPTGRFAAVGAAAAAIAIVAWPLLFTNAFFDRDWEMHLWYLWHQSTAIREDHFPSLFVHYAHSVFYPEYAFYGGTTYALAGALSALLGGIPLQTYLLTYCAAFAGAYGGWYWMGRMAGLRGWTAHAPGLVFVTSASYLTIVYGRGDWLELMAVSSIPPMVAAGLSVLRAERLRVAPAFALAAAGAVFCGSHNMTLLWGSTFLAVVGALTLACVPAARRIVSWRGALRVASLLVGALLLSAWFLLPELAYESHTVIGSGYRHGYQYWHDILLRFMPLVSAGHLFTFSRASVGEVPNQVFALPVLAIAWVAAGAALLWRARPTDTWMRLFAVLAAATIAALVVMTHAAVIFLLPHLYAILQFSYRLESYVLLGLCGAMLAALARAADSDARRIRIWRWTLAPVLLVSLVGAVTQLAALPLTRNRSAVLSSYTDARPPGVTTTMALEDYEDVAHPFFASEGNPPSVHFQPAAVRADRVSAVVHFPTGTLITSNLASGPELVHVTGARIAGIDREGNDVLEVRADRISVSPAHSLPLTAGHLLTLLAAIALTAELAALAVRAGVRRARTFRRAAGTRPFPGPVARTPAGSSRTSSRS